MQSVLAGLSQFNHYPLQATPAFVSGLYLILVYSLQSVYGSLLLIKDIKKAEQAPLIESKKLLPELHRSDPAYNLSEFIVR